MAKKLQTWKVKADDGKHTVTFAPRGLFRKAVITIDELSFTLDTIGFHKEHEEVFRLGDSQAILSVGKNGKAEIVYEGKKLKEKV